MSAVSNPYIFNIKKNYNCSSDINIVFTSQAWTTPGTYSWIASFTGLINVEVAGAGGGGLHHNPLFEKNFSGGNGDKKNSTVSIIANANYSIVVGKGGNGITISKFNIVASAGTGGTSSFDNISAQGGTGARSYKEGTGTTIEPGSNAGNGQGGVGGNGNSAGSNGWVKITKQ